MKRNSFCFFFFLTGIFCVLPQTECSAAPAGRQLQKSVHIPYRDPMTGKLIPARIGTFAKTEVRVSPNRIIGTRITYRSGVSDGIAQVYIYSLQEKPARILKQELESHRQKIMKDLMRAVNADKRFSSAEILPGDQYRFRLAGRTFRGGTDLFISGKFIVKVHLILPEKRWTEEHVSFRTAMQKLFNAEGKRPSSGSIPQHSLSSSKTK